MSLQNDYIKVSLNLAQVYKKQHIFSLFKTNTLLDDIIILIIFTYM